MTEIKVFYRKRCKLENKGLESKHRNREKGWEKKHKPHIRDKHLIIKSTLTIPFPWI